MAQVQIPFISAPFKKTADVDWIFPLKHYIAHVYQEDPEKYNEETFTLNRLRQDTRGAGKDITGRDLLYRYFGQLELLDLRFPVDEKHVKVLFTWYDAFDGRATAQYSLAYEKASVIFNIAATLSAIAAGQNRAEAEGRKMAFNFFQAAAGMFQYINDNFLHAPSQDLSRETVKMLTELMLAQAHECFLESSLREKKKDGLIAKLGSHAAWTYENLVYELQDSIGRGVGIDKAWVTVCQVKQKYYQALAQEHRAALCEAEQQYGEQVARLKAAESFGKEATKLCSSLNSQLQSSNYANGTLPPDSGSALQELVRAKAASCSEKHAAATRDNDMIYHEAVPQESILTPIDRLKAVKPTQISDLYGQNEIGKVIGADIFARLVPLSVHESASMYSEEKAKLLRGESERCDMAKAELNTALEYMKLPGSLDKFRQQEDRSIDELMVPTKDAREWADQIALEESASRTSLRELIDTLDGFKRDATKKLDESSMSLDQEMRECENMRVKFGQDWSQQPSGHLTGDFRHDIKSHRDALQQAAQSDMELLRRLDVISADINILKKGGNSSDLEKAFAEGVAQVFKQGNQKGDMTNSLLDLDFGGDTAKKADMQNKVKQIEATLEKLRKIEVERKETLQDLREKTMQDDISNVLILNKKAANVEQQIFAAEIEKYRPHQQRISATIAQQQQTLQELTALFKALMENQEATKLQSRYDEAEQQRQKVIGRLARAKHEYFDVKEGLNKGVEFYSNLLDTIESLARNVQNFVQERAQERNRLAEELGSKQSIKEQEMLRQKISSYSMATPSAPSIPPAQTSSPQSIVPDPMSRLTEQARDMSIHDQQHQQTPHSSYAPISAATPQRSMSTHSEQYSMGMPSPATAPAAPPAASVPVSQPYRPSGPSYKAQPTTPQTTMYQTQPYVNAPPYSPVQIQSAYNTSYQPRPAPPPVPPSPGYHQQQPQQQQPPSLPPKPNHPPPQRAPSMPSYPPTSPPPVGAPYGAMPQAQSQSTYSNPNLGYISAPQPLASQQPPAGGYYHHPPPPPQTSQQSYYGGQYPPAPPSSHHQPPPPPGGAPAPGYPPYPYQNTVAHPGPTPGHTWQQQPQQPGYQPPAPHGEPSWNQSNNSSLLD